MRLYQVVAGVVLAASSVCASAADKQQLANQLFDSLVVAQSEALVEPSLKSIAHEMNPPVEVITIHREAMLEMIHHPELRQAYVAAYMQLFSEQELASLIELAKLPAFLAFAREEGSVHRLTRPAVAKINSEMESKITTRLAEKGLSKWKP